MEKRISENLSLWLISSFALSMVLTIGVFADGVQGDSYQFWARYTARLSFIFFALSFLAGPLFALWRHGASRWLVLHRRAIGLCFAVTQTVHLVALTLFYVMSEESPLVIILLGGGFGFLMMYAMALTSNDKAVSKLGRQKWHRLHLTGAHVLAATFTYTYLGRVLSDDNAPIYMVLLGVMVLAYVMRVLRFVKTRQQERNA